MNWERHPGPTTERSCAIELAARLKPVYGILDDTETVSAGEARGGEREADSTDKGREVKGIVEDQQKARVMGELERAKHVLHVSQVGERGYL